MNKSRLLLSPNSCLNKSRNDEPLFVLCARDPSAGQTIRHWVAMNESVQPPGKLQEALRCADEMETWHSKNVPGQVCAADGPLEVGD